MSPPGHQVSPPGHLFGGTPVSTEWFSSIPTNSGLPPVRCCQWHKKIRYQDRLKRSRWYILLYNNEVLSLQCSDTVGWVTGTEGHPVCKKSFISKFFFLPKPSGPNLTSRDLLKSRPSEEIRKVDVVLVTVTGRYSEGPHMNHPH